MGEFLGLPKPGGLSVGTGSQDMEGDLLERLLAATSSLSSQRGLIIEVDNGHDNTC